MGGVSSFAMFVLSLLQQELYCSARLGESGWFEGCSQSLRLYPAGAVTFMSFFSLPVFFPTWLVTVILPGEASVFQ